MSKEKYLGIGCVILGICVMSFPFVKEAAADRRRQEILEQWQQDTLEQWRQETDQIGRGEDAAESDRERVTETMLAAGGISASEAGENPGHSEAGGNAEEVVGILRIPAIELEQPVLKGATERNLNVSVATVEPTGTPGAEGNFVIAGHNSRTYGRHFNRLAELKNGDELFLNIGTEIYTYRVVDVYVVEAEDVWVLGDTMDGAEITLITCHYPKEGKAQRLIIKGILEGSDYEKMV